MHRSFKVLILPSLLTFLIVISALMGFMSYLTQRSMQTNYSVWNLRQSRPCTLCHDGSFSRSALRVAWLPCEGQQQNY